MRLPLFITTLLLGTLQTLPIQALSNDLSEMRKQKNTVAVEANAIASQQNDLLARRPRPAPQNQSNSSKRRSPSSAPQAPARKTPRRAQPQRRSQPTTSAPRPKTTPRRTQPQRSQPKANTQSRPKTTRRAQPQRRSQPKATTSPPERSKTPKAIQTQPRPVRLNTQSPQPAFGRKPVNKPNAVPPTRTVKQLPASSPAVKKKLTPARQTSNTTPSVQQKGKKSTQKPASPKAVKPRKISPQKPLPAPKAIGSSQPKRKTSAVKQRIKPAVTVKKVRDRPVVQPAKVRTAPIRTRNIRVRRNANYQRRRVSRRRRYNPSLYWGNRRVQTRRLTRSYRPCYYCPGFGWSYSPTCYTRPSRYYIFADSYWPSITSYRRSSQPQRSRQSQLTRQVEDAIRDYANLYDLQALKDDIEVSQEGSIIILTGVVDQEETLEDLIAIARDIDGVKYVITDDVIVRELQDTVGLQNDASLDFESHRWDDNDRLDESLSPSLDDFPSILRNDAFEEELEASIPDLEWVTATEVFLPQETNLLGFEIK